MTHEIQTTTTMRADGAEVQQTENQKHSLDFKQVLKLVVFSGLFTVSGIAILSGALCGSFITGCLCAGAITTLGLMFSLILFDD